MAFTAKDDMEYHSNGYVFFDLPIIKNSATTGSKSLSDKGQDAVDTHYVYLRYIWLYIVNIGIFAARFLRRFPIYLFFHQLLFWVINIVTIVYILLLTDGNHEYF